MANPERIGIVGGGWFGLTLAFELVDRAARTPGKHEIVVFESTGVPGGPVRTERHARGLFELGPQGILDDRDEVGLLVRRLGLADEVVFAREGLSKRYLWRHGKLRALSPNPWTVLKSGVVPRRSVLRALCEPLVPAAGGEDDVSIEQACVRRLGRGAGRAIAPAMALGVYGGDPARISYRSAYPRLAALEREHGSWLGGMRKRRRAGGPQPRLMNFHRGLQSLTDALAARLGDRLKLDAGVVGLHPMAERGVRLMPASGPPEDFDRVVVCAPAPRAADLLREADAELADALAAIEYAPFAVVHAMYPAGSLPDLDGFGFLAPPDTGLHAIGCKFSSAVFEGRCAEGNVLTTWMFGGRRHPERVRDTERMLLDKLRRDLRATFGVALSPSAHRITRWPLGIPQYDLGHAERVARIRDAEAKHPALTIFGNATDGVAVTDGIVGAATLAEKMLEA